MAGKEGKVKEGKVNGRGKEGKEPVGIPFGSKSKGKLSPRPHSNQRERKRKHSFLSKQ